MTINAAEIKETPQILQEKKVDPILDQKKVDTNVAQQSEAQEDPNWRAFREARKKDRADREAAERRAAEKEAEATALKAAMEAAFSKGGNMQPQNNNQNYGYAEEETTDKLIEKKVQAALAARDEQYRRESAQREAQEYPSRLNQTYADFNQTISQENLDYLDYHYPEVSRPLQRLHDGYDKWSDIYHAVKKFVPNISQVKKDAAKADNNMLKPKSISSAGIIQPQEVKSSHILSEERKAANWERMERTRKGMG